MNVGPLAGIKVLDLSSYIAGPYGCTLLADLGAEVTKIEAPGGDTLRKYPSTLKAEGRAFLGVNRGKRGLALDLKKPEGLAVLERLVKASDVLVHNFRPGVPPRLRIDYESLKKANPRLVYCAMTGYGDTGPLKDKAGYDQVLQTMTGMCVLQGKSAAAPEILYGSIVDYYAASMVAYGVSAALFHRERTGEGQYVGVSLLRSALAMQSARFIWAEGEVRDVGRDMRSGGITGIHPTKEGSIYISANTPHFWKDLCDLVGLPELAADAKYDSVRKRNEHAAEIVPRIRAALATKTALQWETVFGERVPCAAARAVEDMFDHPQVVAEEMIDTYSHPLAGSFRGIREPIRFSVSRAGKQRAAPTFGEHSAEVLADAGFSAEEIAKLQSQGVLGPVAESKENVDV
jgi:crotonobetainyl-CoA:carnitine CoA-transferase CaiB-like acyl-CoA transferase